MASSRVVVVHPSRIFREALSSLLAGSAFEPAHSTTRTDQLPRDAFDSGGEPIVVVGVAEPGQTAEAVRGIAVRCAAARIVVIGGDLREAIAALEAGACSFLEEDMSASALIKALELVALGEPFVPARMVRRLQPELAATPSRPADSGGASSSSSSPPVDRDSSVVAKERTETALPRLSERESAILGGLVQGAPNKVIAHRLNISEATVKVHVKAILRKIRVKNRTQAAIWAMSCRAGAPRAGEPHAVGSSNGWEHRERPN